MIILAVTLVVYMIATVMFCYTTKPEVLTGEFPFSITYEYKGETNTLSGVLACEYLGSKTIHREHKRYWNQETIYHNPDNVENPCVIEQNDELLTTLAVQEHMCAGYFMGDPLHENYYAAYGYEGPEPYVEYYDYKNEIYLDDENRDEVLESIGFEIVDFTSLVVNNNDTLRITAYKHIDRRNSILEIYNKKNGSRGYIKAYYSSDDTRYYLCCSVAEYFKDKNVKVENYLIYNKQEVASYVDCMYNL